MQGLISKKQEKSEMCLMEVNNLIIQWFGVSHRTFQTYIDIS